MDSTVSPLKKTKPRNWRLHLMRGLFFLNFISLAYDNWSTILFPKEQMGVLSGVAISFWAGFSLLNFLGIRFPLKMIPILLLQLLYKSAWIIGTYLPAHASGTTSAGIQEFFWICIAGIVLNLVIIPWKYTYREFCKDLFKFGGS
ncbi:hypothetical protein ACFSTE_04530 [Aquimarina hainanensis]|uniref:Uncharacterized protein n=1 Tax=Aquimarina hainanensis TaxID=1578017 RepID=A0ABW5N4R6_9FLAO